MSNYLGCYFRVARNEALANLFLKTDPMFGIRTDPKLPKGVGTDVHGQKTNLSRALRKFSAVFQAEIHAIHISLRYMAF